MSHHQNWKSEPLIATFPLTSPPDVISCVWLRMHKKAGHCLEHRSGTLFPKRI